MPFIIRFGDSLVSGTRGAWTTMSVNWGRTVRVRSLIDAFACRFAGDMVLAEMADAFELVGVTLGDFIEDDHDATLAMLQSRIRLAEEMVPHRSQTRVDDDLQSMLKMWDTFDPMQYPLIAETLRAAIGRYQNIHKAPCVTA